MAFNVDYDIASSDWPKRTFDFPGVKTLQDFIYTLGLPTEGGELRVALARFYGLPWVDNAPDEIRKAILESAQVQGMVRNREHDLTDEERAELRALVDGHNRKMLELGLNRTHRTTLTTLATVYQRGLDTGGDAIYTPSQWAFGRVDAFLHLLRHHTPHDESYTVDNDLLPERHPKRSNP